MTILILLGGVCASFIFALTSAENSSFLFRRSRGDSSMRSLILLFQYHNFEIKILIL